MYTEAEAKTKWCPFARVAGPMTKDGVTVGGISGNRIAVTDSPVGMHLNPTAARCIASECMAWRWSEPERERVKVYHDSLDHEKYQRSDGKGSAIFKGEKYLYEYTDVDAGGRFDLIHRATFGTEPRGYCGLSGTALSHSNTKGKGE